MGDESGGNVSLSDYAFNLFLKIKMLIDEKFSEKPRHSQ